MVGKSILLKLLLLVICVSFLGFGALIYLVIENDERALLDEKRLSVELMTIPVLHSIYGDMNDERAEMARHLIEGLKEVEHIDRALIIRANGEDEAFLDLKTIKAVRLKHEIKEEWVAGHEDRADIKAPGVDTAEFKEALRLFRSGRMEGIGYIEEDKGRRLFTYVTPIEERTSCLSCHEKQGARGYLMISSPLDDMYASVAAATRRWVAVGLVTVASVSFLLFFLIRKFITVPISELLLAAKVIAKGRFSHRVKVETTDECGELALAMNEMAVQLDKEHTLLETEVEKKSDELRVAYQELEITHTELKEANEKLGSRAATLETSNLDLERANEEWENLERLKTEFLQTMSHELRSPLTPILGYLELLGDGELGKLTEVQSEVVSEMNVCGKNLLMIIDELLEAATIQSGDMFIEFESMDLHGLLTGVVSSMDSYAQDNGIMIETAFKGDSVVVMGDKKRLAEIFTHLLRNAVKFSSKDSKVMVKTKPLKGGVEVAISDSGIGIAFDRLTRIFDSFYQVSSSTVRQYEGLGLGLYLVKKLVDSHSGTINVTSKEGEGTTFTVFIPAMSRDRSHLE